MNQPADVLRAGSEILGAVLACRGFRFMLREAGAGSGGPFAWGEYVRGDRRLALHVRQSLGLVTYHLGDVQVPHEGYVRLVNGAPYGHAFPGFSPDPLDGFRHLQQDLERHGAVFLGGTDEEVLSLFRRVIEHERRRPKGLSALFESGD